MQCFLKVFYLNVDFFILILSFNFLAFLIEKQGFILLNEKQ